MSLPEDMYYAMEQMEFSRTITRFRNCRFGPLKFKTSVVFPEARVASLIGTSYYS
jgi:hypothetical protein